MSSPAPDPLPASYVLPIRWTRDRGSRELASYLRALAEQVEEVIVVDGSPPGQYARLEGALPPGVAHVPPAERTPMGKVGGVLTGARIASHEALVIADDDVRWERAGLERALAALRAAEIVRPQNYFEPLPWHARIDTARSLINRACSGDLALGTGDFPGTLVLRRSALERAGGYDGDVMFENLELMRTVVASGGRLASPLDLYVRRLPPDSSHHLSQRVRQAYDDFALPARMATWLVIAPLVAWRPRAAPVVALAAAVGAEAGRRRAGGARVFPASSSLLAPVWVAERAACAWLALWQRLRGGVTYGGGRIRRSATPMRELRRRYPPDAPRTAGNGLSASPSGAPSA